MGRRDNARMLRVKQGLEPGIHNSQQFINYVKCKVCGVVLPEYRVTEHFAKYHSHIKVNKEETSGITQGL